MAETLIAMPDGSNRRIDEIAVGDTILGAEGAVNMVRAIKSTILGDRPLYALNASGYFVTASHPFLTETGWKSLDPDTTMQSNPTLQVGHLSEGDKLVQLAGVLALAGSAGEASRTAIEIETRSVELTVVDHQTSDGSTQLFNLHLDGNQTYFANNLLVHNKP